MSDPKQPTAWGHRIRRARLAHNLSAPAAAARAQGVSGQWWGNIERGYQNVGRGKPVVPVRGEAPVVAQMAHVVGVSPEELEEDGRPDAAQILRDILAREAEAAPRYSDPALQRIWDDPELSEGERLGAIEAVRAMRAADAARHRA